MTAKTEQQLYIERHYLIDNIGDAVIYISASNKRQITNLK